MRFWLTSATTARYGKCWLGEPGATFGSTAEREACTVHGTPAAMMAAAHRYYFEARSDAETTQSWAVTVERDGIAVVTVASNCLSGRDLSDEDARIIRLAAAHLRAGEHDAPASPPVAEGAP